MKKFFKEFGEFLKRGNALDLAVGIIIGGAFQKIVSSLVNDIIMPLFGVIIGVNISDAKWVLQPAVYDQDVLVKAEIALNYGTFIQTIVDFLIIGLAIFVAIKIATTLSQKIKKASDEITSDVKSHKKNKITKTIVLEKEIEKTDNKAEMENNIDKKK